MHEITPTTEPCEYSPSTPITMAATKSFLWTWLLTFSTFGIYIHFWFFARAREFNKLSHRRLLALLWFFVPINILFVLFAAIRLNLVLNEMDDRNGLKTPKLGYILGILGMLISLLYLRSTSKVDFLEWLDFAFLLLLASSFSLMTLRVNQVKNQLTNIEFVGKKDSYNRVQWIIVIIMLPITIGLFTYSNLVGKQQIYGDKTQFEHPHVELTFHGTGWGKVSAGQYSDGGTLAEFSSLIPNSYAVIYQHGHDDELNKRLDSRRIWIRDNFDNTECQERRRFVFQSNFYIKSTLECKNHDKLMPTSVFVTYVQTKGANYEYISVLTAPTRIYNNVYHQFEKMAWEFSAK